MDVLVQELALRIQSDTIIKIYTKSLYKKFIPQKLSFKND